MPVPFRLARCLLLYALLASGALPHGSQAREPAPWSVLAHTSFAHFRTPVLGVGTALAQDRQGYIWFGTQTGLMRWDGFQFRRYLAEPGRPGSLPDSYILSLRIDGAGRLWVGTNSGGIARYDDAQDRFIAPGVGKNGLAHGTVTSMADDGHGGMWVGTGGGLERVAAGDRVHGAGSGAPQIAGTALPKGGVDALLRDRGGALWIGTRKGVWRRDGDGAPLVPVRLPVDGSGQPAIGVLYQDSAGRIWIGTRAHGAFVLRDGRPGPVAVTEAPGQSTLEGERVFSIAEKSPGVVWLGTEGGGIVEVDVDGGRTRRIRHQAELADSLIDDDAIALLRDRSGQMMVATVDGLNQHDPRTDGVVTIRSLENARRLGVPSMLARPDGSVWLGVAGGTIAIVDPLRGVTGDIAPATGKRRPGLPRSRIIAMANGPGDTVFIGTQQGLFRSAGAGGGITRVEIPGRANDISVRSLAWRDGVLWMGGMDGLWGLAMGPDGMVQVIRREDAALGDTRVTALLARGDGSVWVGTMAGLARLAPDGRRVERIALRAEGSAAMPADYITSIIEDDKGRIWISTFSAGVVMLAHADAAGRRGLRHFDTAHGLPDNGVNALVRDAAGRIWVSTDNGLAAIDPATFAIRQLGTGDGVHISAYWSGSGARTPSGDILFGGLNGFTVLRPDRIRPPAYRASMAITGATLGGRPLAAAPLNGNGATPLRIAPEDRERGIAVEFSALDFAPPGYRSYTYRLDGFDRDWIEAGTSPPRASYTNLPPGSYTLLLRGTVQRGPAAELRVPVVALPSWHQTAWVRALAGVSALLLLVLLVQARTSWLRRKQRELEALVEGRTAELKATQARLEEMAYGDTLTGLPNRRLFNDALRRMTAQAARGGAPFTLLLIDLDHFKSINDTLGHDAGDALLVTAAERLRAAVREGDLVARLGGDEFAILLAPGHGPATIREICERIVAAMAVPVPHGAHTMRISASVGVAGYTAQVHSAEKLYKCADIALYQSKEAGRNTWTLCEPQ